jgi:hypothetical protein
MSGAARMSPLLDASRSQPIRPTAASVRPVALTSQARKTDRDVSAVSAVRPTPYWKRFRQSNATHQSKGAIGVNEIDIPANH